MVYVHSVDAYFCLSNEFNMSNPITLHGNRMTSSQLFCYYFHMMFESILLIADIKCQSFRGELLA